jgi:hypothetical protein
VFMSKVLDTPYVYYELQGDLLIATYKKDLKVNLDMAKEIIRERHEFTEHQPVALLVYNQGVVRMDKKARELLSSGDGVKGIVAAAIVVGSPFTSFMANFFVSVNKPKMPARVFSDPEGALKWLEKYRK